MRDGRRASTRTRRGRGRGRGRAAEAASGRSDAGRRRSEGSAGTGLTAPSARRAAGGGTEGDARPRALGGWWACRLRSRDLKAAIARTRTRPPRDPTPKGRDPGRAAAAAPRPQADRAAVQARGRHGEPREAARAPQGGSASRWDDGGGGSDAGTREPMPIPAAPGPSGGARASSRMPSPAAASASRPSSTTTRARARPRSSPLRIRSGPRGARVGRGPDAAIGLHGRPETVVSDDGTAPTGRAIPRWPDTAGIAGHAIAPGEPQRHAFAESFVGRPRDGCLDDEVFDGLAHPRRVPARRRHDRDHVGPRSSPAGLAPAQAWRDRDLQPSGHRARPRPRDGLRGRRTPLRGGSTGTVRSGEAGRALPGGGDGPQSAPPAVSVDVQGAGGVVRREPAPRGECR